MGRGSTVYVNGTLYTEHGVIENGRIQVSGEGIIEAIGSSSDDASSANERVVDLQGRKVIPGLIDVHVHGSNGFEVMNPAYEQLDGLSRYFAEHGTTSFLATTGSGTVEEISDALSNIRDALPRGLSGAEMLGVHLEGPFLNDKRRGAFKSTDLRPVDLAEMQRYIDASGNSIRLVTMAPEIEEGRALAAYLIERGIRVSIGHSDATYEEVAAAVEMGCLQTTHHFNGMRPLHHREPGVAGAGLIIPELTTELIADGIHVHPAAVKLMFVAKTPMKVCVITDAVGYAGLPNGVYGESTVENGQIHLTGSDTLAGSSLTMIQALRNVIRYTSLPLETVLPSFTIVPAKGSGEDHRKGSLAVGKDGDFLILDDELVIHMTCVRGKTVYQRSGGASAC